jgi:hypothetical protein
VYSPSLDQAQIHCPNGTRFPAHLGEVTKLTVPMGCRATLQDHILTAPTHHSLSPPAEIFTWTFDPLNLPAHLFNDAAYIDAALSKVTLGLHLNRMITEAKVEKLSKEATLDKEFSDLLADHLTRPHILAIVIWSAISLVVAVILGLAIFGLVRHVTHKPKLTLNECLAELQRMLPESNLQQSMAKTVPDLTEDDSSEEELLRVFHPKRQ